MTNKLMKRSLAVLLAWMMVGCLVITGAPTVSAEERATNVGLAAHCLKAYREDWTYVWGGTTEGYVDCSGLIWTYHSVGGIRFDMLYSCQLEGRSWGYVSNGIPNIHGLGLHSPGHVGVYIGSGMAVDARDYGIDVCYQSAYERPWVEWFMITGVDYPYQGWVLLDGDSFYYERGQYITNTTRIFNGVTYRFNRNGVSDIAPPSNTYVSSDGSKPTAKSAPLGTAFQNLSELSKQTLLLGNSVTVNCQADGGKAPYTYAVYYRKESSTKWSTVQNYQKSKLVKITPQAATNYVVRVAAKDANGRVVQQDLTMTVYKPLENTSKLNTTSIKPGERVKVRCSATGGAQPYQYTVSYKASRANNWTRVCTYVTDNLIILKPTTADTYEIRVYVRDTRGKIIRKVLYLNVKK